MPDASVGILRRALGGSAQRTTAIYNRDPTGFGFDDEALQDSVSGKGDDITGVEREHTLVALEACACPEAHVEGEADLRDVASFRP